MTSLLLASAILVNVYTVEVPVWDLEEKLAQLAFCESSNNPKAYVHDDGGSPSIGLYQFKQETWNWAVNRYIPSIVKLNIWNPEHQKIVAKGMLLENRWEHWLVCGKKIGLKRI